MTYEEEYQRNKKSKYKKNLHISNLQSLLLSFFFSFFFNSLTLFFLIFANYLSSPSVQTKCRTPSEQTRPPFYNLKLTCREYLDSPSFSSFCLENKLNLSDWSWLAAKARGQRTVFDVKKTWPNSSEAWARSAGHGT